MFTRNAVVVLSLLVLLVEGDLDSNDIGMDVVSTDKDTTSDEAPTESMSAISPHQPDTGSSSSETPDVANQVTAAEPAAASPSSVESEDEDENSDSREDTKVKVTSRSAKPQPAAQVHYSPRLLPLNPVHVPESPALLPTQPVIPQPKAMVRSRASKRRSRTSRRQV